MRRIVLKAPKTFAVEEVEKPKPGPGEALVRVKLVGVCGSDMHLYRLGKIGEIEMSGPLVIGHECMGVVEGVADEAFADLVGKRVFVEPQKPCCTCRWCVNGLHNMCPNHSFLGLPPTDGAMQEYLVHPTHLVEPLPDKIDDAAAVALEPMAVALHALNLAKVKPGETIVILGTGVLGTCVLMLLRLEKDIEVVCVDLLADRLERAVRLGASAVVRAKQGEGAATIESVRAETGGVGADVVFECAGVEETLFEMCEVAAPGGHVIVIGSNPEDRVAFSSGSARRKGLTLRFVRRSLNTFSECLELAKNGAISPGKIVTHTFAASDVTEAYETVGAYADGVLKAFVDMEKW